MKYQGENRSLGLWNIKVKKTKIHSANLSHETSIPRRSGVYIVYVYLLESLKGFVKNFVIYLNQR